MTFSRFRIIGFLLLSPWTIQFSSSHPHGRDKYKYKEQAKCDEEGQVLESSLLVELKGALESITKQEVRALKRGFVQSFYQAIKHTCPEGTRTIEDVSIALDESPGFDRSGRTLKKKPSIQRRILYRITGRYRGGRRNASIFSDGTGRRELGSLRTEQQTREVWTNSNWVHPKHGKGSTSSSSEEKDTIECDCPAPMLDTIAEIYHERVQLLTRRGFLSNIEAVLGITKVVELDCSELENTFETDVLVDHFGDVDAVTPSEIQALEQGFADEYNALNILNPETCDPLLRIVDEVTIDVLEVSDRRRLGRGRGRNGLFTMRYRTKGRCRGCRKNTKLLNDSTGRVLSQTPFDARELLMEVICICPDDAEERPPSEEEIETGFNDVVQNLKEAGVIENIESVENIESNGELVLQEGEVYEYVNAGDSYVNTGSATADDRCGAGGKLGSVDICLLSDLSASFGDDLFNLRDAAMGIFQRVNDATISGARFGVAGFSDYDKPFAYRLFSPLSDDEIQWLAAIYGLEAKRGGDLKESQLDAIVGSAQGIQIGSDFLPDCGWSSDLTVARTLVVTTDAPFHLPVDGPNYQNDINSTCEALKNANNIRVLGLKAKGAGDELDVLANATGGTTQALSSDGSNIASAIMNALKELPCQMMPVVVGCGELLVSFDPPIMTVPPGGTGTFTETYSVPISAASGTVFKCEVQFSANGQVIESHPVTIMVP